MIRWWHAGPRKGVTLDSDLISVIVPIFNSQAYLEECLSSIAMQSYETIQVVMVDDGSIDESCHIAQAWVERDPRFELHRQQNSGVSEARNRGLSLSSGRYVGFVDSDDVLHPQMYEFLFRALRATRSEVAYCAYSAHPGNPSVPWLARRATESSAWTCTSDVIPELCRPSGAGVMVWNKLFRRELIGSVNFATMPESQSEDFNFLVDILPKANQVARVDQELYFYRQAPGSLMRRGTVSFSGVAVARRLDELVAGQAPDLTIWTRHLLGEYLLDTSLEIFRSGSAGLHRNFLVEARPMLRRIYRRSRKASAGAALSLSRRRATEWLLVAYAPGFARLLFGPVRQFTRRRYAAQSETEG